MSRLSRSFPKTNKSGRPSAYHEKDAAEIIRDIFYQQGKYSPQNLKKLKSKDPNGLAGWDIVAYMVHAQKSERLIMALVNKLAPDRIDGKGMGEALEGLVKTFIPAPYARDEGPKSDEHEPSVSDVQAED